MVDFGTGSGRFLLWLAKKNAESRNYLGLEIRQKLVKRANFWVKELGLSNVHFIYANAMVSSEQLISSYPGPLELVSILCPDPHFKKRHQKRRVVHKPLVNSILQNLKPGGKIFVQSDVLKVAQDMRNQLDEEAEIIQLRRLRLLTRRMAGKDLKDLSFKDLLLLECQLKQVSHIVKNKKVKISSYLFTKTFKGASES